MWILSGKCRSKSRLDGKIAVVTGANSGIGKETALHLALRGGTVVLACRNAQSAEEAMGEIRKKLSDKDFKNGRLPSHRCGSLDFIPLDLSSLASVQKCGEAILQKYPHVHLLINNAGVFACDQGRTKDNIELQMGINHIGHFLLTCILLPRMIDSQPARIINLSSVAHRMGRIDFDDFNSEKSYSPVLNYARSKLANVLFTRELARKLRESGIGGVTTYAVHPGIVQSNIGRHLSGAVFPGFTFGWNHILGPLVKSSTQGVQTTLHCALDQKAGSESGFYYSECKKTRPSKRSKNDNTAALLWQKSVDLAKVTWNPFTEQYNSREHGFAPCE